MQASIRELVEQAARGDAEAYCRLIRQFERPALSAAYAVLLNAADAGDVVQETFLRAWQKLGALQDADRFGPWVMQMSRNAAIDRLRKRRPIEEPPAREIGMAKPPEHELEADETRQRIEIAMGLLDDTTRQAVTMRYFDNLSAQEIAQRLGMTASAVYMRVSRARERLREVLADLKVS